MYSVSGYGAMIADRGRMEAYTEALKRSIYPGAVVLDLGAGTGIFSLLACQLGAKKVYAIEYNPAIEVAKKTAIANGYADKIEFIQQLSTEVELPELVDVIISDLRGIIPLFERHIESLADARKRFLRPGGVLIPQKDVISAAIVEAPNVWNGITEIWDKYCYGFQMDAAKKIVTNIWRKGWVTPSQLLAAPQVWTTLDYTCEQNPNASQTMTFQPARSGTAYGLSVWFETTLIEGIGFSTAPGMPELIYGTAFFPFSEPVTLRLGDKISVHLQANLVNNQYIWRWDTRVFGAEDPQQCKVQLKQSTFSLGSLSPKQLRKQAGNYRPKLNRDGKIAQFILDYMSQDMSLSVMAKLLVEQFPEDFSSMKDALTRVGQLSALYSE